MEEVKPNLEIWVWGYFNHLLTLNSRVAELTEVVSKVHESLDGIKEELALINNGNKTLIDYFQSEIIKEKEDGKNKNN